MGKVILQIISLLIPALLDWWDKRKAEKVQQKREARRDAVNADPAGEFVRSFNPDARPANSAHTTNSDKPDPDTRGGNNVG